MTRITRNATIALLMLCGFVGIHGQEAAGRQEPLVTDVVPETSAAENEMRLRKAALTILQSASAVGAASLVMLLLSQRQTSEERGTVSAVLGEAGLFAGGIASIVSAFMILETNAQRNIQNRSVNK